jgi:glycosyltransferase involved in cell wall biosynthesis
MFSGLFRPWHGSLLRAFRSMRLKVVVTFQDYRHPELPQNSPARRRKLGELLVRADRVTAVSRFLLARVLADFPSIRGKSSAVPNGTDVMEARPVRKKPYILSIGRYSPYKGTDLLLWAYAEFLRKGHDADLVLCGPKFREKHFSGLAQRLGIGGRVRMLGLKRPEELLALRRDCLFYAAASRFETFGMAILEAMAAGKAVLATAAGGIPEFVRNGRNGLLAGPEGLADGMARLFKDARLRERLGANGRRAAERFRWGRIAGEYLRLYS